MGFEEKVWNLIYDSTDFEYIVPMNIKLVCDMYVAMPRIGLKWFLDLKKEKVDLILLCSNRIIHVNFGHLPIC